MEFMQLEELLLYFETSPAIRLLRSPHAPLVADFLHQQFKRAGRVGVPHADLQAAGAEVR